MLKTLLLLVLFSTWHLANSTSNQKLCQVSTILSTLVNCEPNARRLEFCPYLTKVSDLKPPPRELCAGFKFADCLDQMDCVIAQIDFHIIDKVVKACGEKYGIYN